MWPADTITDLYLVSQLLPLSWSITTLCPAGVGFDRPPYSTSFDATSQDPRGFLLKNYSPLAAPLIAGCEVPLVLYNEDLEPYLLSVLAWSCCEPQASDSMLASL
jgi:hypothetical protein